MNFTEMTAMYRKKVSKYTLNQCHWAIRDIHDTLQLQPSDIDHPYVKQLYCELDAVRERRDALSEGERWEVACRRASTTDET